MPRHDNVEVARNEGYCNLSILPKHQDIIFDNFKVPDINKIDMVKLENITVNKTSYPAIDGTYKYVGLVDGQLCFDFSFDRKPMLATIWLVLYNDYNSNKKINGGEVTLVDCMAITEQKERVCFDVTGYEYSNFEVFFTAS